MATTTVTATLLDANGVARVGEYVYFRLKTLGVDKTNDECFPTGTVDAITDANGQFSEVLWVNGDSDISSVWEIIFPGKGRYDVIIPTSAGGGTIDLADLIADNQTTTPDSQQSTVYALAIQRANHTGTQTLSTISDAGTAAASNVGDFATAAQGATADTALQPGDIDTFAELDALVADETLAKASDIGVTVQAYDASLTSLALLATAADKGVYTTAADTYAEFDLTTVGRALLDDTTTAAQRATLGLATNAAPSTTLVTSTTYTLLTTDSTVLVDDDTAGAPVTITLLTAAAAGDGFRVTFKKLGTTGNVVIDGDTAETIDGATTLTLTKADDSVTIESDGTEWHVVSGLRKGEIDTFAKLDAIVADETLAKASDIGTTVQAFGDVLDDFNTLGAPSADGEFIVATGAGAFAYESGSTVRTSLGLGTDDSPAFSGLDVSGTTTSDDFAFDTAASPGSYTKGVMRWNDTFKCPEYDNGDDAVTNQIGQENHVRVVNQSGGDILDGKVVRINGASGDLPTIVLAQADTAANASGTIGLATHNIESTTQGTVTTQGRVSNIDTSAFIAGDIVYLDSSTAGGLTATPPTIRVRIGIVMTAHATTGSILVNVQSEIPEFGSIYVKNGVASQALSTSFTKINEFTTNGADSGGISDVANDKLILTRGVWVVNATVSAFSDTATTDFIGAIFLDGTELDFLQAVTHMKSASEEAAIPITGIVIVDQDTEDLDLRMKVDAGTPTITIVHANLNAHKIG